MVDFNTPYTPPRPTEEETLVTPTPVTPLEISHPPPPGATTTASAFNTPHNSPRSAFEPDASDSTTRTWTEFVTDNDLYIPYFYAMNMHICPQAPASEKKRPRNEHVPTLLQTDDKRRMQNILCNTELSELEQEGEVMRLLALRERSKSEAKRPRVVSSMD